MIIALHKIMSFVPMNNLVHLERSVSQRQYALMRYMDMDQVPKQTGNTVTQWRYGNIRASVCRKVRYI